MAEMKLTFETRYESMEELRPLLDQAFQEQFPGGMLQRKWNGAVLELSGPGAQGAIRLEAGVLVGEAQLSPPASLMKVIIEQKVSAALKKALG
jgi:hypothetical protein